MSIYYCKKTRRQFLIGAGNSLLALPLLPSLIPRSAHAVMPPSFHPKLFLMRIAHSNVREAIINPDLATQSVGNIGARQVNLRSLSGSLSSHMPILRNSLYNNLMTNDQISIVRGFSVGPGGHGVSTLGGPVDHERISEDVEIEIPRHPTIDWAIERSNTLYPANTPSNVQKALRINLTGHDKMYYIDNGNRQNYPTYGRRDDGYLFSDFYTRIFGSLTGGTVQPQDNTNQFKSNILNRVLSSYNSTMSGRRISSADRLRVESHMDYLSDIQRAFASAQDAAPPISCDARPGYPSPEPGVIDNNLGQALRIYLDMLAVAFQCGLTRFASIGAMSTQDPQDIPQLNLPEGLGVHGAFHGPQNPNNRNYNPDATPQRKREVYEKVNGYIFDIYADHFFSRLNVEEGTTGRTYIDNMMTAFVWEIGTESQADWSGHGCHDLQHILVGSMGGRLRSGNYTYYQGFQGNRNNRLSNNAFLITLLHLLGIPSSEYSTMSNQSGGFGYYNRLNFGARDTQPLTEIMT